MTKVISVIFGIEKKKHFLVTKLVDFMTAFLNELFNNM